MKFFRNIFAKAIFIFSRYLLFGFPGALFFLSPAIGTENFISNPSLWTHFTTSNGLPTNEIRHVLEDNNGNLLIVTVNDGIYRYDGLQFIPLEINEKLPSLFIQKVIKDEDGRLWIAINYEGIWIYDFESLYPFEFNSYFRKEHFTTLFKDLNERIWIDVNKVGLFRFDGTECINLTEKYDLLRDDILQIYQIEEHHFHFFYARSGIFHFYERAENNLIQILKTEQDIFSYFVSKHGEYSLILTRNKIMQLPELKTVFQPKKNFSGGYYFDFFLEDLQGRIWFLNNEAIYCIENNTLHSFSIVNTERGTMYQDRFQNIWFATSTGIYKYINAQMNSYLIPSQVTDVSPYEVLNNNIIFEDKSGVVWFTYGTNQIYSFNGQTNSRIIWPDSLKNVKVMDIAQDYDENFWFATLGNGILRWDGKKFDRPISERDFPAKCISSIFVDSQNRLWIGAHSYLMHLNNPKSPLIEFTKFPEHGSFSPEVIVTSQLVDETNTVWFGTQSSNLFKSENSRFTKNPWLQFSGSYYYNVQNLHFFNNEIWGTLLRGIFKFDIPKNKVNILGYSFQIPEIHDSRIFNQFEWSSCDFFYNTNSFYSIDSNKNYKKSYGKNIYNVSATDNDPNGGKWIGSYSVGLFYVNEDTLIHYNSASGMHSHKISTLHRSKSDDFFVGTLDFGLFKWKDGRFYQTRAMKKAGRSISTCYEDNAGNFWVGTLDNGLVLLQNESIRIYKENLPHPSIWGIGESNQNRLYVCLRNADYARLDGEQFEFLPRETILTDANLREAFTGKSINYRDFFIEQQSRISPGLACWDGNKLTHYSVEQGLPGHEIVDITETLDGKLWVATYNTGIAVRDGDVFKTVANPSIEKISNLLSLHPGIDSSLWVLSVDEGIANFKGDSCKLWGSNSKIISSHITGFGFDPNGQPILASNNDLGYFKNGNIYIIPELNHYGKEGSLFSSNFLCDKQNKITCVTISKELVQLQVKTIPPVISIRGCQIGNDLYDEAALQHPIFRGYSDQVCAIDFFGYHSSFPSHTMEYSHRIIKDGKPGQWSDFSHNNRIIYTELEPGKSHTFEIKTETPNGLVSSEYATVEIHLETKLLIMRFWFKWFLFSLLLVLITLFFIYRFYKINQLIRRRRFNPYVAGEPIFKQNLFFGRKEIQNRILSIVHNNSIMITGERRIGKTSLLLQIKNQLTEKDDPDYKFIPVFVDLQGVGQWEFFHAMMHDIVEQIVDLPDEIGLRMHRDKENYSYRDFNNDFRKIIFHSKGNSDKTVKIVLLIDEADAMNEYDQAIHAQLRRIFMQEFSMNFAAIISGTSYIKNWNRPESPWWNLFTLIELKPIPREEAKKLIYVPVKGIFKFKNDALETILEVTSCKPYLIQALCLELINQALDEHRRTIKKQDVLKLLKNTKTQLVLEKPANNWTEFTTN